MFCMSWLVIKLFNATLLMHNLQLRKSYRCCPIEGRRNLYAMVTSLLLREEETFKLMLIHMFSKSTKFFTKV